MSDSGKEILPTLLLIKHVYIWTGEMVHQLRVRTELRVLNTMMGISQLPITPDPRDPMLLESERTWTHTYDMQ